MARTSLPATSRARFPTSWGGPTHEGHPASQAQSPIRSPTRVKSSGNESKS